MRSSSPRVQVVVVGLIVLVIALAVLMVGTGSNSISGKQYAPSNPSTPSVGGEPGLDVVTQRCYAYGDKRSNGDNEKLIPGANISYYGPKIETILKRLRAGEEFEFITGRTHLASIDPERSLSFSPHTFVTVGLDGRRYNVTRENGSNRFTPTPSTASGLSGNSLGVFNDRFAGSTFKLGPYTVKDIIAALDYGESRTVLDEVSEVTVSSSQYDHTESYCNIDKIGLQLYTGSGTEERGSITNGNEITEILDALTRAVKKKGILVGGGVPTDEFSNGSFYVIPGQ